MERKSKIKFEGQESFDREFAELVTAPSESDHEVAERVLRDSILPAAQAILDLLEDDDVPPKLRFEAARYVLERELPKTNSNDKWQTLFAKLTSATDS